MPRRDTPWPPGTPCWIDLLTPDPASAQAFYRDLFGWEWTVETVAGVGYATATIDGSAVCGLLKARDGQPPVWNTYLASADLEPTSAAVLASGGHVLEPIAEAGDRGRFLVAQDVTGAVVCVWEAAAHVGCEVVNEPGSFVWTELLTRDYDVAKQFYADVFGVGLTEIGDGTFRFATIEVDGNTVGGIGAMPDAMPPDVPAHWRLYFAAADTDATMHSAVELGASVTVEAHDTPFGRWGGLTDPQGAGFCVITPPA